MENYQLKSQYEEKLKELRKYEDKIKELEDDKEKARKMMGNYKEGTEIGIRLAKIMQLRDKGLEKAKSEKGKRLEQLEKLQKLLTQE